MMNKRYIITTILYLTLIGFPNVYGEIIDDSPYEIYKITRQKLQNKKWKQALIQLEDLVNYYPFSSYIQQIQLDLIYTYYMHDDFEKAQNVINQFMKMYPTHSNIDYVIYMHGLTSMAMDDNVLHKFFSIDRSDRDPKYARDALNDFHNLICNYPNSQYVANAIRYSILLKNRISKYEYSVANYYAHLGAWVAVINRVSDMLHKYPDTQATLNGLILMEKAYRKIQMYTQADKVKEIISSNRSHQNKLRNLN